MAKKFTNNNHDLSEDQQIPTSFGSERTAQQVIKTSYLDKRDLSSEAEEMLEGDAEIAQLREQGVELVTKSNSSWKHLAESKDFAELVSQTKEISASSLYDAEEMRSIQEREREHHEKLDLLEQNYQNLNAKPLSSVDSYDSYSLVLNKSNWNYAEIKQRNTNFTLLDLAIQTHLYLYNGNIIPIEKIQQILSNFVDEVANTMMRGYAVLLNPVIILDTVRFDKSNILPIAVANPKLMSPINIVEWDNIVKDANQDHILIIDTFIVLIENALSNGHEAEFFKETLLVRNAAGITSLFISEEAPKYFQSKFSARYAQVTHEDSTSKK